MQTCVVRVKISLKLQVLECTIVDGTVSTMRRDNDLSCIVCTFTYTEKVIIQPLGREKKRLQIIQPPDEISLVNYGLCN